MIIEGKNTDRKLKIISVDKTLYSGDKKRFSVCFNYIDDNRIRPNWKEFDSGTNAILYINEIEKLI